MDIIKASSEVIQKHLIMKRSEDIQDVVRKSVFEFLLMLDANEVSIAFTKENPELFELIFNSLRDEDSSISKIGLSMIYHLMQKMLTEKET